MNQELKYRHELKYMINRHQYHVIQQQLKHLVARDPNAGSGGEYHIRSLYFDDISNKALFEKLAGVRDRVKYRIRIYNIQDNVIHFEKKIKFGDYIAKRKEPLTREMFDRLLGGDMEALNLPERPLLLEIYQEMKHRHLRPKVIVDYVREAYVCPNGNVRVTFDKELRTGMHEVDIFNRSLSGVRAIDDNFIIMELKYDEYLPDYIRTVLQLQGLRQQSASKYVICRKYLKTNTWEDY